MYIRLIILIALLPAFFSCESSGKQNDPADRDIASLPSEIDFSTVDVYPLFRACNNCDAYEKQNRCFENVLLTRLEKNLGADPAFSKKIRLKNKDDHSQNTFTLYVDLLFSRDLKVSIVASSIPPEILETYPDIEQILKNAVAQLPEVVQPALKRGIPVSTRFRLPIVISLKEQ